MNSRFGAPATTVVCHACPSAAAAVPGLFGYRLFKKNIVFMFLSAQMMARKKSLQLDCNFPFPRPDTPRYPELEQSV